MEFIVVPFAAQVKQNETTAAVATQMQSVINSYVAQGWEYLRMDSVQTSVAGSSGCFGLGATPGYVTTFNVLVFKR